MYRSLTHPLNRLTGIKKAFLEQVSRGNILLSFLAGGVQSLETAGSINITPEKVFSLLPRGSDQSPISSAFQLHLPAVTKLDLKAFKMMQLNSDPACNKHSLINVMHRFIAAANNMDETIMVPSLLRDMPLEEQVRSELEANNNETPCPNKQRDMYEHYLLLKSIKNDMEWGLLKREMSSGASFLEMAVKQEKQQPVTGELLLEENADLEHQFHYHLRGLFGVLSKLTMQADHLTNRYKREIGGGNFMR